MKILSLSVVREARSVGQAFAWVEMGNEALGAIHDLRWMLVFLVVLIIADYRFGRRESMVQHQRALEKGDEALAKLTEFRWSKAVRRTCNKFVDYMTLLLVFCLLGIAVTEPYGLCSHIITSAAAVLLAFAAEIVSIVGHFFALKGWKLPKLTWKSVALFFGRLAASFAKTRSEDFGNALDETVQQAFSEEKKENKQVDIDPIETEAL